MTRRRFHIYGEDEQVVDMQLGWVEYRAVVWFIRALNKAQTVGVGRPVRIEEGSCDRDDAAIPGPRR